jgi:hypothetical protein
LARDKASHLTGGEILSEATSMQKMSVIVCAMFGWVSLAQAQQAFQITGIDANPMTRANLCASLGGNRQPPVLVIRHSKVAGVKITIKMFDDTSRGSHINHGATTVISNASGATTARYAFIPPCNVTRSSTSNYSISAETKGSKKQIVFGRYDSAARRIFK